MVSGSLRFEGRGRVRGRLFWQGSYPGMRDQPGLVHVEIYRIVDPKIWAWLDQYEECDHSDRSLFYRKITNLYQSSRSVWVYYLGSKVPVGPEIKPL
jgi:gamma-glutamylcyclotransferase (GGCT)/AIG2-like uncharacterized protein YtfP